MRDCIKLLEALEAIYEVAVHPGSLPHALAALDEFLNVRGVHMVALGTAPSLLALAESEQPEKARYTPAWCNAELARAIGELPPGEAISVCDLVLALKGASAALPVLPAKDLLAAAIPTVGPAPDALLLVPIVAMPESALAGLKEKLAAVLPHVARAFQLSQRWIDPVPTIAAAAQLLRELPLAALLTDSAGRCIESNNAFRSVTEPLSIQLVAGRVRFHDSYLQDSWQSALGETAQTAVGRALLAVSGRGRQWKVYLLPIRCYVGEGRVPQNLILAVYEEQGSAAAADPERFASVGKLTPAELDVLSGLLQGYTGKVIARSRGASVNTVRSQIMSILSKTGHRSQKELIAAFGASTFDPSAMESTY